MDGEWLYALSEWFICGLSIIILLLCERIGYRLGNRSGPHEKQDGLSLISALQATTLGVLSLLIGFTFSMASNRFEQRKALVVEEANAIGTAALRARLLPAPYVSESERLLRAYVDVRVSFQKSTENPAILAKAVNDSSTLHQQLWQIAIAASAVDPHSLPTGLFIQSLNEMIDLHQSRLRALRNHVPQSTILMLYAVAFVGLGFTGYDGGLRRTRHGIPNAILAIMIASVIITIVDLDRPLQGLVTVSDQPLLDLQSDFDR